MTTTALGNLSLNIAFLLYLINYFPQLFKNRNLERLVGLSLYFHALLLLCYLTDLLYGLGMHMPWQYITVSLIGTLCLFYQHYQMRKTHQASQLFRNISRGIVITSLGGAFILLFNLFSEQDFLILGYVSQFSGIIFFIPQLIRQKKLESAESISFLFVLFILISSLCDNIAAWSLDWPMPNKIGSSLRLCFSLMMLLQYIYYFSNRKKSSEQLFDNANGLLR